MRSELALCLVLALAALPAAARAETTADRQAAARHYKLGKEAYDHKRYAEALPEYEQAYDLAPRPLLLYHLGLTYQALRRDDDARQAFERYLASSPTGAPARDARARLDALAPAPPPVEAEPRPAEPPPGPVLDARPPTAPPARPLSLVPTAEEPSPHRASRPRWGWVGAGALALGGGLALDLVPSSAKNGNFDALDVVPIVLYGAALTAAFLAVR